MSYSTGEYIEQPFSGLGDARSRGAKLAAAHVRKLEHAIRKHAAEADDAARKAAKWANIAASHRARAAALAAELARLTTQVQQGASSAYVGQRRVPVRHARRV